MKKNLIKVIFDLKFNEFITTRVVKVLFIFAIILSGLASLLIIAAAIDTEEIGLILGSLIIAPVAFLLYVTMARIWLELIIVVFRIAENSSRLVEQGSSVTARPQDPESGPQ